MKINKKIRFLILAIIFFPIATFAINTPEQMAIGVQDLMFTIGICIVVIGWIIAGIMYLTSMGSPEKTAMAKKAMIAAVIGTVLVIIAEVGYTGIKIFLSPIIGQ